MVDLSQRMQLGIDRYGTLLRGFNGRSSTRDAYEEVLDLAAYLRTVMDEFDALLPVVAAAFRFRSSLEDVDLAHADPQTVALAAAVDELRARGDIDMMSSDGTRQVHLAGLEAVDGPEPTR